LTEAPEFDDNFEVVEHHDLYNQVRAPIRPEGHVLAVGEVLWDVFHDSTRLGGAPLNFTVNVSRMGHEAILISAVGDDGPGRSAREAIEALGLDTRFIRTMPQFPTGSALVQTGPNGQTAFRIQRPAAYDAAHLSPDDLQWLAAWTPDWLYYGTLFSSTDSSRKLLHELFNVFPKAKRFYDINLRPEFYSEEQVMELLSLANVVKLNETEMDLAAGFANLPRASIEAFCRAGSARFGWKAACVTLGAQGCGIWNEGKYAEAEGCQVEVVDTVGAGDGFAAAFLHGLSRQRSPHQIAEFANRIGAGIASSPGAIPDWNWSQMLAQAP
jgi:fructokinase